MLNDERSPQHEIPETFERGNGPRLVWSLVWSPLLEKLVEDLIDKCSVEIAQANNRRCATVALEGYISCHLKATQRNLACNRTLEWCALNGVPFDYTTLLYLLV